MKLSEAEIEDYGKKIPYSQRWKNRRRARPVAPKPVLLSVSVAPVPVSASVITEAQARVERTLVERWIRSQIIAWPPNSCFCCRRPILAGQKWTELVIDNDRARFHADCAPVWKLQQEAAARRALGLKPEPALTEKTP